MPTLVWIRRPESGSRSGEAAVPDPVVSAAPAVPGPVVSSSDVALPAVSSRQHANGGKKKKREINHANAASATKKRSRATSDRDLPLGIYKTSSGKKFKAMIRRGGKTHYIGMFDTPEQASAAYLSVRKDLDDAKLSSAGAEVHVDALFDSAQKKARESVGVSKRRRLPTGVYKTQNGKFRSSMQWSGKQYGIGTFDTPDEASAAYASVKKALSGAKLSTFTADKVDDAFETAQTKASVSLGRFFRAKQDVSAAVPAVSSVASPAVSSKHYAGGGKKTKKRKMNRAKAATTAKKQSKAAPGRELPTGVYNLSTGYFQAKIRWGGKNRYIGQFDTPEQASAAFMSVKKVRDDAKQSGFGADEVNVAFDAAKKKALEASGRVVSKRR